MKIAVSTYSFNPLLLSGAITQFACIEKAVEMGFDAIEFVDILPHDGSSAEEYAKKLRAECEKHSLPISARGNRTGQTPDRPGRNPGRHQCPA